MLYWFAKILWLDALSITGEDVAWPFFCNKYNNELSIVQVPLSGDAFEGATRGNFCCIFDLYIVYLRACYKLVSARVSFDLDVFQHNMISFFISFVVVSPVV